MTSHTPRTDVNNNNKEDDWEIVKPRIESNLEKVRRDLDELRQSDRALLRKFIKMRSEIKEISKDIFSLQASYIKDLNYF